MYLSALINNDHIFKKKKSSNILLFITTDTGFYILFFINGICITTYNSITIH